MSNLGPYPFRRYGTGESGNWEQFCEKLGIPNQLSDHPRFQNSRGATEDFDSPRFQNNETVFSYRDLKGRESLRVIRIDKPNGKKSFFQKHLEGSTWVNGGYKGELQPYLYPDWEVTETV